LKKRRREEKKGEKKAKRERRGEGNPLIAMSEDGWVTILRSQKSPPTEKINEGGACKLTKWVLWGGESLAEMGSSSLTLGKTR